MILDDILSALPTLSPTEMTSLVDAIEYRRKFMARQKLRTIRLGDTVTFANHIRPSYLAGLTAEVVDINKTTVSVKCPVDPSYGRFSGSPRCRLPIGLVA